MAVAGTAKSAVPTTAPLWARPDTPTPARSAANRAPTDAPTATPTPLMIWVMKRRRRVRRWTAAASMLIKVIAPAEQSDSRDLPVSLGAVTLNGHGAPTVRRTVPNEEPG